MYKILLKILKMEISNKTADKIVFCTFFYVQITNLYRVLHNRNFPVISGDYSFHDLMIDILLKLFIMLINGTVELGFLIFKACVSIFIILIVACLFGYLEDPNRNRNRDDIAREIYFITKFFQNITIKKYKKEKEIKDRICVICREELEEKEVKFYYHLDNKYEKDSDCFLTYHEECFNRQLEYQKQNRIEVKIVCSCKRSKLTHRTP